MYVTVSPSRTVVPSIVTSAFVSVLNKTLTVTVYSRTVKPSAAVTVTRRSLLPGTKSVSPVIS